MEDSDAAVVGRVCAGDTDAFRVLVERHSVALFRLAYRMTGNQPDAQDVVQEIFLRAFRHLRGFDTRGSFPAWLHRIGVNCALNLLNQRQRQARLVEPAEAPWTGTPDWLPAGTPTPDCQMLHTEVQQQVQSALTRLTPREKAAFVLRHFEDRSIREIAALLGIRANTAKQNIFRAVHKMRRELGFLLNAGQPKWLSSCAAPHPLRLQQNGEHNKGGA